MDAPREIGVPLLTLARGAIARALGLPRPQEPAPDALRANGATFVTLRIKGDLRGCIGSVSAWRPLADDVRENAVAAALRDPRFVPLSLDEFDVTAIEVSLLGPYERLSAASEDEALAALRPGVDGVILELGRLRATFLPQVWEQLPLARDFMSALKRKAGVPARFWSEDLRLSRYAVEKFVEDEMKAVQ